MTFWMRYWPSVYAAHRGPISEQQRIRHSDAHRGAAGSASGLLATVDG